MIKLLTIDSEHESARKLGYSTLLYCDETAECFDNNVVIRWGNGGYIVDKNGKDTDFKNVINRVESIKTNCTKNQALVKMSTVVKTPKIFLKTVPSKEVVVLRETSHSGGYGFQVVIGPKKIYSYQYATKFIRTKIEFRVWFCNGKTMTALRITRKKNKD